ncbi:metallophosphoesterase family protein [Halogeometricum luteum]|uniref:Metallophosphoesterase n=1 Tax=Halogeometricum luteum TaxID=2950537 RepID=A0ABU2G7I0_9EURY|nr:metallophosphoesterase [Halogeometricum sp. S3BR5-2]MDS0296233.1 metallophosphoesterase [Halogeometricum sp. S3BR5-2]
MSVEELAERPQFAEDDAASAAALRAFAASERPLARFDRPRAATPTRVAVVSDPHVSVDAEGTWKVFHRTQELFRETLADAERRGADAIVVSGDLTKDGEERDIACVRSILDDVGVPVLVVPGNHDVKERRVARFERLFTDGGFPVRLSLGGLDVVGLNSATALGPDGEEAATVSDAQLERLDGMLADSAEAIVVSHHNLPGLAAHVGDDWAPHPPVENADALLDVLSRHDVPLHLSGHVHLLSLVRERGVRGLVSPGLCSFPQSYLLLDVDETGTTVRSRTAATREQVAAAYEASQSHSARSSVISGLNAEQLSNLPLVDERADPTGEIRPIRSD